MTSLIVLIAKYFIILPVIILCYLAYRLTPHNRLRLVIVTVISLPIAYIIAKIGGHFYSDPRPFAVANIAPLIPHAADNGFPSDHALLAAALASVTLFFNTRLGLLAWLFAILIGVARMLAHVHHGIDILGSFAIAGIAVALTGFLLGKWAFFKDEEKFMIRS